MSTSEIYKVSIPGSAYTSGAPEFTAEFSKDRVTRGLVLCVMFCSIDRDGIDNELKR
jgi:hypothetical protein